MTRDERFSLGYELGSSVRVMTHERQDWYGNAQVSSIAGEPRSIGRNIHTDPEYAREQGWPDVNASGMVSTSWISSMLIREYGRAYIEKGELRTKYIRPIYMGTKVTIGGHVDEIMDDHKHVHITLWAKDDDGNLLTEGEAVIPVSTTRVLDHGTGAE